MTFSEGSVGCRVDAADVLDEAVVADDTIAQGGATDAAVLREAFAYLYRLVERAERHLPIEICLLYVVGAEIVCHRDVLPLFCRASLTLESSNLTFIKFPHKPIFLPD